MRSLIHLSGRYFGHSHDQVVVLSGIDPGPQAEAGTVPLTVGTPRWQASTPTQVLYSTTKLPFMTGF